MSSNSNLDSSSLFSANGLVAVITGGGTGLGLMMASALEGNGATVYIVGRRKEVLEKAAKEKSKYGKIIPLQGDVTSRKSIESIVATIEAQVGYVNLLVNNAAIMGPLVKPGPSSNSADSIKELQEKLWEASSAEIQKTFEVNITAVYDTTVAFLQLLDKGNKHGGIPEVTSQIITVSAIAGLRSELKPPMGVAYPLSKGAAIHLGKMLANMLKDWQIRSNVIAPGIYLAGMAESFLTTTQLPGNMVPLKRPGLIEDIGGIILFLATRAGAYVNGHVAVTDGGRLSLSPS